MELFEWSKHYIKFKDCMKKNILEMKCENSEIQVKEKKRNITYFVEENIDNAITKTTTNQETIITLNTKQNFDTIIDKWDELKNHHQLTIILCHPNNNQTWIVHPSTHHKITEKENLKEGLETLYNSISRV